MTTAKYKHEADNILDIIEKYDKNNDCILRFQKKPPDRIVLMMPMYAKEVLSLFGKYSATHNNDRQSGRLRGAGTSDFSVGS